MSDLFAVVVVVGRFLIDFLFTILFNHFNERTFNKKVHVQNSHKENAIKTERAEGGMPPHNNKSNNDKKKDFKYKGLTGGAAKAQLERDLKKFDTDTLEMPVSKMNTKSKKKQLAQKQHKLKQKMKELVRKKRQLEGIAPRKPLTQDVMRKGDETIVKVDHMEEIEQDEKIDEFSSYFNNETTPKLLITTGWDGVANKQTRASTTCLNFIKDLLAAIPNSFFFPRRDYFVSEIVEYCKNREFTDIWIIGQRVGKPYQLMHVHLPEGPTAYYRLSSGKNSKQIRNRAKPSKHAPELIMNNFTTRLGLRVARMLQCTFPQKPQFVGRRVITWHNQRDFVFFRHHRYEFKEKSDGADDVIIQEIGPRFTLRLEKLQLGAFDPQFGEFEWYHKRTMDDSRTRFFL